MLRIGSLSSLCDGLCDLLRLRGLKRSRRLCLPLVLAVFVTACGTHPQHASTRMLRSSPSEGSVLERASTTTPTGTVLTHHVASKMSTVQARMQSALEARGVKFHTIGEDVTVVIPADEVFKVCSPKMREDNGPLLHEIARYLHFFKKHTLDVAAYTDNTTSHERSLALTLAQSKRLAHYLWTQNIDVRVLSAEGYGESYPIATNSNAAGQKTNRRLELTFRRVVG